MPETIAGTDWVGAEYTVPAGDSSQPWPLRVQIYATTHGGQDYVIYFWVDASHFDQVDSGYIEPLLAQIR